MKSIIDKHGMHWIVEESDASHGVGYRGEFQPLPPTLFSTITFQADDGRKIVKTIPTGTFGKMKDEEILNLLDEPEPDI